LDLLIKEVVILEMLRVFGITKYFFVSLCISSFLLLQLFY